MKILAVDPGRDAGWALLDGGKLVACGLTSAERDELPLAGIARAFLERPQIYRSSRSKANPNDIITLALGAGRFLEKMARAGVATRLVLPAEWKGQVDPDVMVNRILGALSPEERGIFERCTAKVPKGKQHNVADAVGLAKWGARLT